MTFLFPPLTPPADWILEKVGDAGIHWGCQFPDFDYSKGSGTCNMDCKGVESFHFIRV